MQRKDTGEKSLLELEEIGFRYDSDWVIRRVSLRIGRGEFLGIIGPNGSGKTTLLKLMNGLLRPQEGSVRINGAPLAGLRRKSLARMMAVVPQDALMVFPFTVREIVLMGRYPHFGLLHFEDEEDVRIAEKSMEMAGVLALADRNMHGLSGGERQRVLIARALAQEPEIILLDEPTAFQDIRHQAEFFNLIRNLNLSRELTVIAVTHDINLASSFCNRIMLLNRGEVEAIGPPSDVITRENIMRVYEADVLVDPHPVSGRPRVTLAGG